MPRLTKCSVNRFVSISKYPSAIGCDGACGRGMDVPGGIDGISMGIVPSFEEYIIGPVKRAAAERKKVCFTMFFEFIELLKCGLQRSLFFGRIRHFGALERMTTSHLWRVAFL